MKPIRIALCGLGTVGYGVYDLLTKDNRYKDLIQITKILTSKPNLVPTIETTQQFESILMDDSIDVVVELIGGMEPSYTWIKQALLKKKHVVTANKAVLAAHYDEFMELARTQHLHLGFEASVGGGIPIIHELFKLVNTHEVVQIKAILNGSTNYVLDLLFNGTPLSQGIMEAQALGYMEKDPSQDIDGIDIANKLVLLARLAFQAPFEINQVERLSLNELSPSLMEYVIAKGYQIKYIATAQKKKTLVQLGVYPIAIDSRHLFASIQGAHNIIEVTTVKGEIQSFTGLGAGRYPTAQSVIMDLIDIATKKEPTYAIAPLVFPVRKNTTKYTYLVHPKDTFPESLIDQTDKGFIWTIPLTPNQINAHMNDMVSYIRLEETV